jgi:transposase
MSFRSNGMCLRSIRCGRLIALLTSMGFGHTWHRSTARLGRPSIDPELLIRMLIVGYCLGIRSERRLCEEVHLNLAYRWFCRLGLDGLVPEHSTFSKNRHGRFRESDLLRRLFETVLQRCINEGLIGGSMPA